MALVEIEFLDMCQHQYPFNKEIISQVNQVTCIAGFSLACESGCLLMVKELLVAKRYSCTHREEYQIDLHACQNGFYIACSQGHSEICSELLALEGDRRIDVHAEHEWGFQIACSNGNNEVVKMLLALDGARQINVHLGDEAAFRHACANGNNEVVKMLLVLEGDRRIDIHAMNGYAFRRAWMYERYTICCELLALSGDRYIELLTFQSDKSIEKYCTHRTNSIRFRALINERRRELYHRVLTIMLIYTHECSILSMLPPEMLVRII